MHERPYAPQHPRRLRGKVRDHPPAHDVEIGQGGLHHHDVGEGGGHRLRQLRGLIAQPEPSRQAQGVQEVLIVAGHQERAVKSPKRRLQGLKRVEVQGVGRLVQHQQGRRVVSQQQAGEGRSQPLAPAQSPGRLVRRRVAEQEGRQGRPGPVLAGQGVSAAEGVHKGD
jgi:hypothetical protein